MKSKAAYPWFYFLRVARLSFIVFIPTLILILVLYRSSYKEGLVSQMTTQVKEDLANTKFTLDKANLNPLDWCQSLPAQNNVRYSLVNYQGISLCDTLATKVGQHINDMTEVQDALTKGFSSRVRYSDYFKTISLFSVQRLGPELVIRKIIPISSLKDNLSRFDRQLFLRIVPFAFISYLTFLCLFYFATKPLGVILSKVEKNQVDLPFKKTLRQLYQKDKWAQIEAALNETDQKLQEQINQTKLENEKIGTILESIYDDIIAIDPFETILFYNTNFNKNFVSDRRIGEILPKLWHLFKDEEILAAFRSVLKDGRTIALKGMNLFPGRFFDLTVTPLKSGEGKIIGALGVFYDVTDFKLNEQMRVDFVANVSHEIRTPLTSIKGYTQILESQRHKFPEELQPFLGKILTNTERMIALFSDLLNLSVIESKFQLKKEKLSLLELVESISDSIATNYPLKQISFAHDLKLEFMIGDHRLMEQVISNLMDNACKYSGEIQQLAINISSFEKNNKAYLVVADNGPGISPEHRQRIFERFYRIDPSRETSRGTGLGLSIVKHIIARHEGKIWVESQEHQGSTFIIELPLE